MAVLYQVAGVLSSVNRSFFVKKMKKTHEKEGIGAILEDKKAENRPLSFFFFSFSLAECRKMLYNSPVAHERGA